MFAATLGQRVRGPFIDIFSTPNPYYMIGFIDNYLYIILTQTSWPPVA